LPFTSAAPIQRVFGKVQKLDAVRDELHEILVARNDDEIAAVAGHRVAEGGDNIVGLITGELHSGGRAK
jgi:hypothetical protein